MPNENEKRGQGQNQGNAPEKGGGGTPPRTNDPSRRQDFNYDDEPKEGQGQGDGKKSGSSKQPSGQPSQPWQDRGEGNTNNSKQ